MTGVRDTLNQRPALAAGLMVGFIALAAVFWFYTRDRSHTAATEAFYSDDDGKTYFVDDFQKLAPFDRNGKVALRAYVFRCGTEAPFVGYLARYPEATKAKIADLRKRPTDPAAQAELGQLIASAEVRKPGQTNWVAAGSNDGEAITAAPQCKDGKQTAVGVVP